MKFASLLSLTFLSSILLPLARSADADRNAYIDRILVANRPELAPGALIDKHLLNPWGIALRPPGAGGHFWLSNAGNASTSTYLGDANGIPIHQDGLKIVFLDGPLVSYEDGLANVTGQVYNAASDFEGQPIEFPVAGAAHDLSGTEPKDIGIISGSAKFVFVTTDGTINAWRAGTKASMDRAVIVKDYSDHGKDQIHDAKSLPAFTGVAMSTLKGAANRLYVTDFAHKEIRVLDNAWNDITAQVPFQRPAAIPADWGPYNVQCFDNRLYVAYAALNADADDPGEELPGEGMGHVAVHDLEGKIIFEFEDQGRLNAPWGFAIAPENWGPFSRSLLVSNFGDGTIAAFNLATGKFQDYLRNDDQTPISIDGIWGLAFGNGVSLGDLDSLYYAAGPNGEQDGIFGRLRHAANPDRVPRAELAARP